MNPHDAPDGSEPDNAEVSRALLSRRRMLTLTGAGIAAAGLGAAGWASTAEAAPATTTASVASLTTADFCGLSAEQVEGPYYLDYELFRRDIREDRTGVPLALGIAVLDSGTCRPVPNAMVEIWHCDALGVYSGYTAMGSGGTGQPGGPGGPTGAPPSGTPTGPPPTGGPGGPPPGGGHSEPTDDLTWLRGAQQANRLGLVEFTTIVPGWYSGRAVHIHVKVHTGGRYTADGYTGGTVNHVGQFYFDETAITRLTQVAPYRTNTTTRVPLDQDSIYPGTGSRGGLLRLAYDPNRIARGVIAGITVGIDPTADNSGGGTTPTPTATP